MMLAANVFLGLCQRNWKDYEHHVDLWREFEAGLAPRFVESVTLSKQYGMEPEEREKERQQQQQQQQHHHHHQTCTHVLSVHSGARCADRASLLMAYEPYLQPRLSAWRASVQPGPWLWRCVNSMDVDGHRQPRQSDERFVGRVGATCASGGSIATWSCARPQPN